MYKGIYKRAIIEVIMEKKKRTGYKKAWVITTKQIAQTTGKSIGQTREDVRSGICNPAMLFEFCCYVLGHHTAAPKKRRKIRSDKGVKRDFKHEQSVPSDAGTTYDTSTSQERNDQQSMLHQPGYRT